MLNNTGLGTVNPSFPSRLDLIHTRIPCQFILENFVHTISGRPQGEDDRVDMQQHEHPFSLVLLIKETGPLRWTRLGVK